MTNFVRNDFFSFKCTACDHFTDEVYEHPILKVSVCKTCCESIKFATETNNCCFWCARLLSGLLCCSQCPHKCCVECIERNLGQNYLNMLDEQKWCCFICESEPVEEHQKEFLRMVSTSNVLIPEGAGSTSDITSPFILVDDTDDNSKKHIHATPRQDLDFFLNIYEKQIQASLELEDANIPAILKEINSIKPDQLRTAIFSYRRCLSAFASDLSNLEDRVTEAEQSKNSATLVKLTSLLRILVQHHIFNRICHPQTRIKDDARFSEQKIHAEKEEKGDRKEKEVNDMVLKIKDMCNKQRQRKRFLNEDFVSCEYDKRRKLSDTVESLNRRARSLVTPSWLSGFRLEKENAAREVEEDQDWTDPRIKSSSGTGRRGRPPKYARYSDETVSDEYPTVEDSGTKRGRGRPRKLLLMNEKEPRYFIPKRDGLNLTSAH